MSFFRNTAVNNLSLKALSVLLAFLLWAQVANQETVQRTIMAPVEFLNIPAGLEISNEYTRQVEVVYRTDRPNNFDPARLSVVVDLEGAVPETAIIHLTQANIPSTDSAEIVSINPARIRLQLETTLTKVVRVEALLSGTPAQGYEVTETRSIPAEVPLSGPESHIEEVTQALTQALSIEGRSESIEQVVSLDLENPRLRFGSTDHVRVSIVIEEKRKNVVLRRVRVEVVPEEATSRLLDTRVTLRGTVPRSFEGTLDAELFTAVIDVGELTAGQTVHELIPQVDIPEDYRTVFRVSSTAPEKIRVRRTG